MKDNAGNAVTLDTVGEVRNDLSDSSLFGSYATDLDLLKVEALWNVTDARNYVDTYMQTNRSAFPGYTKDIGCNATVCIEANVVTNASIAAIINDLITGPADKTSLNPNYQTGTGISPGENLASIYWFKNSTNHPGTGIMHILPGTKSELKANSTGFNFTFPVSTTSTEHDRYKSIIWWDDFSADNGF